MPSSPGRAELVMAIDRELRLQRRGLEEVAAGVRKLVEGSRHRKPETTIDTRRAAVARREADLVEGPRRAPESQRGEGPPPHARPPRWPAPPAIPRVRGRRAERPCWLTTVFSYLPPSKTSWAPAFDRTLMNLTSASASCRYLSPG